MVIHHDSLHHTGFLVPLVYLQDISFDAVVEGTGGDVDFVLRASDIIPHRENLVVCDGDQVVGGEVSPDENEQRTDEYRGHHPQKGSSRRFDGYEFIVLGHLSDRHHRSEKRGEREGDGQHCGAAPEHEFQNDLEAEAFADEFVDIQPKELHHQDENDDGKDTEERSYERLQYELVEFFHPDGRYFSLSSRYGKIMPWRLPPAFQGRP